VGVWPGHACGNANNPIDVVNFHADHALLSCASPTTFCTVLYDVYGCRARLTIRGASASDGVASCGGTSEHRLMSRKGFSALLLGETFARAAGHILYGSLVGGRTLPPVVFEVSQ
jgi:hypothetical protein